MAEAHNDKKIGPQIKNPTESEIQETIRSVKQKYDVVITEDDAISYTRLISELGWWMIAEKEANVPEKITDDMVNEVRENATIGETRTKAKHAVLRTATARKKQIREEIRELLGKYM